MADLAARLLLGAPGGPRVVLALRWHGRGDVRLDDGLLALMREHEAHLKIVIQPSGSGA